MEEKIKTITRILSIFIFLLPLFFVSFTEAAFPPYFFSADMARYPKEISGTTVKEYLLFDSAGDDVTFADNLKFTKKLRKSIDINRNANNVPATVKPIMGYTLYSVNMTMLPSSMRLHKGDPLFDSNQYTRVPSSSPVAILHRSADGKFYFAQTEFMRGWIPASSVKPYDRERFSKIISLPFITITKDNLNIGGKIYNIGDRLPIQSSAKNNFYQVVMPEGDNVRIKADSGVILGSDTFSPDKMKPLAESLIGDNYDWGGKEGKRDCSAYVRDLWRVFGVDLPRNTSLQSGVGKTLLEVPENKEEFYNILSTAKPYKTLIFFKGHVMMFAGMENDDYIIYHAVNRLSHDDGKIEQIGSVAKHYLKADKFTDIWKRVVKVTEIE